tara:strand:- start:8267 stop:9973 length:1707 start_codon:yes stop_codon:yes gene_type:complete
MRYSEVKKLNKKIIKNLKGKEINIAVLSNVTVNSLKEILELELRKEGLNAKVSIGNFDSFLSESEKYSSFDAVIFFWEIVNLVPEISEEYYFYSKKEMIQIARQKEAEIKQTLKNLKHVPLVIFNKFSTYKFDKNPIAESSLSDLTERLNLFLKQEKEKNTFLVDLNKIFFSVNFPINEKQYFLTSELYKDDFYFKYSESIKYLFLALYGKTKKVLVLDCDNTLWGGIIGEDGEDELKLGGSSNEGKIFKRVQNIVKRYKDQGVLIALCSKNNAEDVDSVFFNNKNMILNNEDIVVKKINWKDKASNLKEISKELNLSLDSFIFVDDSKFEIGLINKALPEVKTILVPSNLYDFPEKMKNLSIDFFNISGSKEDSERTSLYINERRRKEKKNSFDSLENYLNSLELILKIQKKKEISISRAAQMCQKTNQFNLTTIRHTEQDIKNFIEDDETKIYTFELSDKFGSYGITGLSICKVDKVKQIAKIDSFLMSCRVIGRNIEIKFLEKIIEDLKKDNVNLVKAKYIETKKNTQFKDFYLKMGFKQTKDPEIFSLEIKKFKSKNLKYIKIV